MQRMNNLARVLFCTVFPFFVLDTYKELIIHLGQKSHQSPQHQFVRKEGGCMVGDLQALTRQVNVMVIRNTVLGARSYRATVHWLKWSTQMTRPD